jgi:CheY-like chemotaxis protein
MRILIVEDSPLVQKMYGMVFPAREHTVVRAANGREALIHLATAAEPFELILLDLRMPDMNGVEFIAEARKRCGEAVRLPILLTTAEPEGSDLVQQARALGITAMVRKPWKPQELREAVQSLV